VNRGTAERINQSAHTSLSYASQGIALIISSTGRKLGHPGKCGILRDWAFFFFLQDFTGKTAFDKVILLLRNKNQSTAAGKGEYDYAMDVIVNATTTTSGTATFSQQDTYYGTSTAIYQYYANLSALLWLTFLILASASFFAIAYFWYKRVNR